MGSAVLHAIVLAALLPYFGKPSDALAPITTSVTHESRLALEPPQPPPPDDFVPPTRPDDDIEPTDEIAPPDDLLAEEWEEERSVEVRDAVRATIFCADPLASNDRFGPRRSRRASAPAHTAEAPTPPPPIGPVDVAPPAPPPPTPAHIEALIRPRYPRTARDRGLQGDVTLRVVVLADGTLDSIQIVTSSGYAVLDRAAVSAVEDWTFAPATVRGVPVRSTLDLPAIRFRLTD